MKHLLKLLDLSKEEIIDILNLADQLKYETKHGIEHHHLKGKCLAMIFEKSSTRTRVSFEVGINQLGGYAVVLAGGGPPIGRGGAMRELICSGGRSRSWAGASRCRTPHACFPAMWTAS